LGRSGLLFVGDCKMAAHAPRAFIALAGDYYFCPLPQVQLAEDELAMALEQVWSGEQAWTAVYRDDERGQPKLLAQGYAYSMPRSMEVKGASRQWSERRLVVRSLRHAQAAETALRARVAKAQAQVEVLNRRGRGRKRFDDIETWRQAVNEIVQHHRVEDFLWLRYDQHPTARPVRAYKERPAYVKQEHPATVEVRVDEEARESAVRRLGWRIYSTHHPVEPLSLAPAVLAYRSE